MKNRRILVLFLMLLLLSLWLSWGGLGEAMVYLESRPGGRVLVALARGLFWIHVLALMWRLFLLRKYRPSPVCDEDELPSCSVVVPAFNEGRMVYETLQSVQDSDYPTHLLEILAVDDGSSDDTWEWMERAAEESGGRIQASRLPVNKGKRHALYHAFRKSRSEILVTIDSDSLIERSTLRYLLGGFVRQPAVGAAAGNVRVLNRHQGPVPKMLEVIFAFSFEMVRASQSVVNGVLCTPGALSAYRRAAVVEVLDDWLNQSFLGRPARIGEDRAMTNLLLSRGHAVLFESEARVYTMVPTGYQGVQKMLLRWTRSNVRESILMLSYIFTRFREGPARGLRANVLLNGVHLVLPQFVAAGLLTGVLLKPEIFFPHIVLSLFFSAMIPALFYAIRREDGLRGLWAIPAALFWMFGLSWIPSYAILSMADSRWLTRGTGEALDLEPTPPPPNGETLRV